MNKRVQLEAINKGDVIITAINSIILNLSPGCVFWRWNGKWNIEFHSEIAGVGYKALLKY